MVCGGGKLFSPAPCSGELFPIYFELHISFISMLLILTPKFANLLLPFDCAMLQITKVAIIKLEAENRLVECKVGSGLSRK